MIRLCFRPSFLALGLALAQVCYAADERGGSFSLVPAVLMPAGRLAQNIHAGPISNVSFDIGISPRWSVIFGAGYADLESKLNREVRLLLAPAWFGFKSKAQIGPSVEVFWDLSAELVYEKLSFTHSGRGTMETLDPAMVFGTGMDLWLRSWLLTGVESRVHLIRSNGEIFPFVQLGLRLGIRG